MSQAEVKRGRVSGLGEPLVIYVQSRDSSVYRKQGREAGK